MIRMIASVWSMVFLPRMCSGDGSGARRGWFL
jgi:hypothetical protein